MILPPFPAALAGWLPRHAIRCAAYIQDRTALSEEKLEGLTEITMDEELSKAILGASRSVSQSVATWLDLTWLGLKTATAPLLAR
jgi:hypothetical protein